MEETEALTLWPKRYLNSKSYGLFYAIIHIFHLQGRFIWLTTWSSMLKNNIQLCHCSLGKAIMINLYLIWIQEGVANFLVQVIYHPCNSKHVPTWQFPCHRMKGAISVNKGIVKRGGQKEDKHSVRKNKNYVLSFREKKCLAVECILYAFQPADFQLG